MISLWSTIRWSRLHFTKQNYFVGSEEDNCIFDVVASWVRLQISSCRHNVAPFRSGMKLAFWHFTNFLSSFPTSAAWAWWPLETLTWWQWVSSRCGISIIVQVSWEAQLVWWAGSRVNVLQEVGGLRIWLCKEHLTLRVNMPFGDGEGVLKGTSLSAWPILAWRLKQNSRNSDLEVN